MVDFSLAHRRSDADPSVRRVIFVIMPPKISIIPFCPFPRRGLSFRPARSAHRRISVADAVAGVYFAQEPAARSCFGTIPSVALTFS